MICYHNLQKLNLFNSIKKELNKGFNDVLFFGEEWYYVNKESNNIKYLPTKYKYMGYYTWYTLDIIKDPDNQEEDFYEALDEKTGLSFDFLNYDGTEAKWYNWESDMKELSEKFPKMMFRLNGTGEEQFDVWDCHFCNGKSYHRQIQTYWEPFDEKGFYKNNKA